MMTDKRRYGVIEVRRRNAETYHLMIDGQMWSEVEWSHDRQAWCVQDAAGHCLAHVEHIVGENRDVQTAIRLMIRPEYITAGVVFEAFAVRVQSGSAADGAGCSIEIGSDAGKVFLRASSSASSWCCRARSAAMRSL